LDYHKKQFQGFKIDLAIIKISIFVMSWIF